MNYVFIGKENALNMLINSIVRENVAVLESTIQSHAISEFNQNKDKVPDSSKYASPPRDQEIKWDRSYEQDPLSLNGMHSRPSKLLCIETDNKFIPVTRPRTPYFKNKKGTMYPLGLYAMGMNKLVITKLIIDKSRKKVVELITCEDKHVGSIDEYNLLALRQNTYSKYEQKYQNDVRENKELIIKKNMLSRDALATTSNLYRAMSNDQKKKLKAIWVRSSP